MLDDIETHIENDNEQATMALLRTLKTAFTGLRIFLILLIAVYLFSGIYKVDEKEHALQMRFGKIIKVSTEPGIYFGLPKPFNSVVKINAKKMRRLEVKFWYKETAQNPLSRDAPANTSGDLHILDDGYNLTGDYNILHTKWSVIYSIKDYKTYYLNYKDPEAIINKALSQAIVHTAASYTVDNALIKEKEKFRLAVEKLFQSYVNKLSIGIKVNRVNYEKYSVPIKSKIAFENVVAAELTQNKKIQNAETYRNEALRKVEGDVAQIISEANAYKQEIVDTIKADANYFEAMQKSVAKSGNSVLMVKYLETISRVLSVPHDRMMLYPGSSEIRIFLRKPKKSKEDEDENEDQPHNH